MERRAAKAMTPTSAFEPAAEVSRKIVKSLPVRGKKAVLVKDKLQNSPVFTAGRKTATRQEGRRKLSQLECVKGFTLLEILLVLAIIGVASLVVFPNITGLETRTFNARVREAHTLLNLARRTAVVSGQPSIARFSVVPGDAAEQLPYSPLEVGRWDGNGIALTFQNSADQEVEGDGDIDRRPQAELG